MKTDYTTKDITQQNSDEWVVGYKSDGINITIGRNEDGYFGLEIKNYDNSQTIRLGTMGKDAKIEDKVTDKLVEDVRNKKIDAKGIIFPSRAVAQKFALKYLNNRK